MSRHRVKSLEADIDDDDVDDYDGGYEDDSQMQESLAKARAVLGPEFTDTEIQDSLWHYYYDVEKTVNYLLNRKSDTKPKSTNGVPKKTKGNPRIQSLETCPPSRGWASAASFFSDCQWLAIPEARRSSLRPLHSCYGGLLGGSSQDPPKQSKLAALAAARRKKAGQEVGAASTSSVALLDKLGPSKDTKESGPSRSGPTFQGARDVKPRLSKPKESVPPASAPAPKKTVVESAPPKRPVSLDAPPSAFARTIIGGSGMPRLQQSFDVHEHFAGLTFAEDAFAGPSPDDVVAKAQSASKGLKNATKDSGPKAAADTKATGKKTKDITSGVADVTISDTPKPRSPKTEKVDILAEYGKAQGKRAANFVVIGHVDAGKSTLMGRLLYDLNVIDKRTIDRYQREAASMGKSSFHLAWVLDQGTEEREHGVTMDVATNHFATATTAFTILDAPGHRDFVPHMIAGAAQADFALLVLDAGPNEFEAGLRGQTKEHALLVRSLGVQRLVVAVNKLDAARWAQDRFDAVAQQTSAFLGAAGFAPDRVAFVPCSGLHGDNVVNPSTACPWYDGPPLLELLEAAAGQRAPSDDRLLAGPFRMPVAEILDPSAVGPSAIGAAICAAGRVGAGSVQRGDAVLVAPGLAPARVKGLDVDGAAGAPWAVAGQNAILHLAPASSDSEDVARLAAAQPGDVVCARDAPVVARARLPLKILAFAHVLPMFVNVVAGRLDAPARVEKLVSVLDKATGKEAVGEGGKRRKKPRVVKPGEAARVVVEVLAKGGVPLEEGARVVLRSEGETVATGLVEAMADEHRA